MKKYTKYQNVNIMGIDSVPNHWKKTKLKFIGNLYSGLTGKKGDDFYDEENPKSKPYINFKNIANNIKINPTQFDLVAIEENEEQNRVKKGDIFFLMSSENFDDIGKTSVLTVDLKDTYLNSFCRGFRIKSIDFNPIFLNYLLLSWSYRQALSTEAKGFTRINIQVGKINDLEIYAPFDKEEQTKIAYFLDNQTGVIDDLIKQKEKLIELVKEKRQTIINEAVTKGLDPKAKMKDSGIEWLGEVPQHWTIKKIKHIKSKAANAFVDGPFGSNLKSEHFIEHGDVYVVESGFITSGIFEQKKDFKTISLSHYRTISRSTCNEGDIIIAKIGANYGMSGILPLLDKPAVVSGNSLKLTVEKENNDTKFIHYYLLNLKESGSFEVIVNAAAQPALSLGTLNDVAIAIPGKDEQIEISLFIEKSNNQLKELSEKLEYQIEKLKEYRQSIISEAVTGKIDVRDWRPKKQAVA